MAAKKKPVETLSLADIGHRRRARSAWPRRPPRWSASPSARRGRRARSSRTKATAASRPPSSSPCRSSSEPGFTQAAFIRGWRARYMAEILVLAEHDGETVKKVTGELLTLARRFGEPVGRLDRPGRRRRPGAAGRVRRGQGVRRGAATNSTSTWSRPRPSCWPPLVAEKSPAAVLVASTAEGKEIAARVAVKTGSGLITDAVGPRRGPGRRAVHLRRRDRRPVQGPHRDPDHGRAPQLRRAASPRRSRGAAETVTVDASATPPRPRGSPSGWCRNAASGPSSPRRRSWSPAAAGWAAPRTSR